MDFEALMQLALVEAKKAVDDVPVGAVLVDQTGRVVAVGHNRKEERADATSHAEIEAIREATKLRGDWRLTDLTLVVTLEPCVMCAGAIISSRIQRVIFGAYDSDKGASGSRYDLLRDPKLGSVVEVVSGINADACSEVLLSMFKRRRLES
jgi:tRNA(adenine34) deaminase